jgi:hypothetical protein
MDYCEFFPQNSTERLRLISLNIPMDIGGDSTLCFTVESRPTTSQRKAGYAGRLEPLECIEFVKFKNLSQSENQSGFPGEAGSSESRESTGSKKP